MNSVPSKNEFLKVLRSNAMKDDDFWKLISKIDSGNILYTLEEELCKLSWTKLCAFDYKFRFLIFDVQNEHDITDLTQKEMDQLVMAILLGRDYFYDNHENLITTQDPLSIDLSTYYNLTSEIWWKMHVLGSVTIRDNPSSIAKSILDFSKYTSLKLSFVKS